MKTQTMNNTATGADSKLKEFFVEQLQDIYWAEKRLVKTLPKMADAATSGQLKQAFTSHLEETKNHVIRLEQAFNSIGETAKAKKCLAMSGITDEGEEIIDETEEGSSQRDAALVFAGQKAEHYEIATYGGLAQLAETLGFTEAKNLLGQTLEEEKAADEKLTQVAKNGINYKASKEMNLS
jgi:ferritin-like metal-binding protein YciE